MKVSLVLTLKHYTSSSYYMAEPPAGSARPVLASSLFDEVLSEHQTRGTKRRRVGTACTVIDDALKGGFEYGRVNLLSGEAQAGKSTVRFLN